MRKTGAFQSLFCFMRLVWDLSLNIFTYSTKRFSLFTFDGKDDTMVYDTTKVDLSLEVVR